MKTLMNRFLGLGIGLTVLLVCLAANSTAAQDWHRPPLYGTVSLRTGFMPDPRFFGVVAGGPIHTDIAGVPTYVTNEPTFRLHFAAGSYPLTFRVNSAADTTLLINLPDGRWIANDDGGSGLNPLIRLSAPMSGQYDIFVGTYRGGTAGATLSISEL